MGKLQEMQAAIAAAAAVADNMTEAQKGGGASRLLPAGYAFGRLVEYVELGNQPQSFNGVAKDPKPEMQLGFALWGEGYQNEDGTPYVVRPYSMSIDRNEKAKAFLLFKAMNWKGDKTCFAQLLGDTFLVKIEHCPKSKTDPKIVSRIDMKGFLPPVDPVTRAPYAIPEAADELYKLFLWDFPTLESWNSLFIEGNWDDGKSKNYTQETLAGATNFEGSALQAMLAQAGAAVPVAQPAAKETAPAVPLAPTASPAVPAPAVPQPVTASVSTPAAPPIVAPIVPVMTSPSKPVLPVLSTLPKIGV